MSPTPNRRRLAALTVASALTMATGLAGATVAAATTDSMASAASSVSKVDLAKKKKRAKTVKVRMFRFPDSTTVKAGTKVVWKNRDEILHTVSSVVDASGDEVAFIDGDLDGAGAKYSVTFTEPGTYDYFCMIHPVMKGRVVVKG